MIKKKIIRWGMIGCGKVTEVKSAPAYHLVEGVTLSAVMNRNVEKARNYAQEHGIEKYYTNADDLINDKDLDAIYIATPPDSHLYYALKVANAGKPCCIEKPLASSYKDSLAISTCFEKRNIPLFVAYYRRSLPRFEQLKMLLDNQVIGKPRHINWIFTRSPKEIDISGNYNWRTDPKVAPGGYFDDLACHGLDLFAYLLGEYRHVSGHHVNLQNYYKVSDAFAASWEHKCGVLGCGSWNFACDSNEDRVEIYGSEGKIDFAVFEDKPLILTKQGETKKIRIENPVHIQLYHVKNMAKQLLTEAYTHPSIGSTATHTAWVMDVILGKEKDLLPGLH